MNIDSKALDRPIKLELVSIEVIREYGQNPRDNQAAVAPVARSIREFGFKVPVILDGDNVLIAGHTRLLAAKTLGMTEVPAIRATDLTPAQAQAFRVGDNKLHELSTWNLELLRTELLDLQSLDVDLGVIGFSDDELARYLDPGVRVGLVDPDDIPAPPDEAITQRGDLWQLGQHRLLCGDSGNYGDLAILLAPDAELCGRVTTQRHVTHFRGPSDGEPLDVLPIHLVNTDPPYNVKVEPRSNNAIAAGLSSFGSSNTKPMTHHQSFDVARQGPKKATHRQLRPKDRPLANDFVSDEAFDQMLHAWFGNIARVLLPGRCFFVWGGFSNCGNYPPVLKECELYFSQAVIWVKEHPVLTRKDFMGNHEWCQPAETAVLTPDGEVPIASLRDGDRVVGYATQQHRLTGRRGGQEVRRATRPYVGELLGVRAGDRQTWVTPGHLWTAKLADDVDRWWCVYLMRRGRWWRVGKSRLISSWGFGLKHRAYAEGADGAWILSVHRTNAEALATEQAVAALYGIPLTVWWRKDNARVRMGDPHGLYDRLDLDSLDRCAARALADHGRLLEYPCVTAERLHEKISRRVPFRVRSANLIPDIMLVPVPGREGAGQWEPVRSIERTAYRGMVHSLEVAPSGHYVADGIVTHNCFYGWREGAAHVYLGPNNATDVWSVKKVNPQSMIHLTEKPVELALRAIQYSSRPGEHVLDLFGGSGSTLIAAEQTQRRAFLMELDPLYCDIVVRRWEQFTGRKAELVSAKRSDEAEQSSESGS